MVKREAHDTRYMKAIDLLRSKRKVALMSQVELAAKLGKRQQFVSKYESGERRLDFIELFDVAEALGLGVNSLIEQVCGQRSD
jgi:transcriptional regulator with XRE-family HTH domain